MTIRSAAITFDVDWAPDWAIALCADICSAYGVPATFYVTHPSDAVGGMGGSEQFELGIHPNFLPGSTQGKSEEEVIDYCLRLAPAAKSMRTHSLLQSTPILALVSDRYPQIETDTSLQLFRHDHLQPIDVYLGQRRRRLTRLPFYWEDDTAADHPHWDWRSAAPDSSGLRIFNFHPIHIAMNMSSMTQYAGLRATLDGRPMYCLTENEVEPYVGPGPGSRTFLETILDTATPGEFRTVSSITDEFRRGGPES